MKFYELAKLGVVPVAMDFAPQAIFDYVSRSEAQGTLLGLWRTGIGVLNQITVLREFDSRPSLAAERERARRSSDPFNCSKYLTSMDTTSFVPFDFFAKVEAGPRGPLYEIRTYVLRPAGLSPLEARWRAMADKIIPSTIIAMYTMDGDPRLVEIRSLGDVLATCSEGDDELSPHPCSIEGFDEWVMPEAVSSLLMPLEFSPLH